MVSIHLEPLLKTQDAVFALSEEERQKMINNLNSIFSKLSLVNEELKPRIHGYLAGLHRSLAGGA